VQNLATEVVFHDLPASCPKVRLACRQMALTEERRLAMTTQFGRIFLG
jgi:hypothetical protein